MCTLSGIPFFWGFTTDRCFLALNRNMRLRAGDVKGEALLMLISFLVIVSMYPLMDAGLNNFYKSNFKSIEYLKSFAVNSQKTLSVGFTYRGKQFQELEFVKFKDNKIICFEPKSQIFKTFENSEVSSISIDSLEEKRYLSEVSLKRVNLEDLTKILSQVVFSGDIQSNKKLSFLENGIVKTSEVIKITNQAKEFIVIENNPTPDSSAILFEIKTIEKSINLDQEKFRKEQNEISTLQGKFEKLKAKNNLSDFETGKNIIEKKRILQEIQKKTLSSGKPDLFIRRAKIENLREKLNPTNQETYFNGNVVIWKKSKF